MEIEWKTEGNILSGEFYMGVAMDMSTVDLPAEKANMLIKQQLTKILYRKVRDAIIDEMAMYHTEGYLDLHGHSVRVIRDNDLIPLIILPGSRLLEDIKRSPNFSQVEQ